MKNVSRKILMFLTLTLIFNLNSSCTKKLEDSSVRMAETTNAMQQSTQQQMNELLKLLEILTQTLGSSLGSIEKNFLTLVIVLQQMQLDLNELAKVSEPVRKMVEQMNVVLVKFFEKKETPNQETEDLSDLLGEEL